MFRVMEGPPCRSGLSGSRLFSRTYLHSFVLTLWDYLTQRASHTIGYLRSSSFHAWYLLYDCEPVL